MEASIKRHVLAPSVAPPSWCSSLRSLTEGLVLKGTPPNVQDIFKDAAWIGFHILIVALSSGVAWSLPLVARHVLSFWSVVEQDESYLLVVEMVVAVLLIVFFNYLVQSLRARKVARTAIGAGLISFFPSRGPHVNRRIRQLKELQGTGRTPMVIGSTGYRTFVDQEGDLHHVLKTCLEARILLMNPFTEVVRTSLRAMLPANFPAEHVQKEVQQSIEFLGRLKKSGKSVTLKLYSDPPLVKLTILSDYIWLQHYHQEVDVQTMPEYVFRYDLRDHGLYALWYQYFMGRWNDPRIPEYDFETSELVYRDEKGAELRRQQFGGPLTSESCLPQGTTPVSPRRPM